MLDPTWELAAVGSLMKPKDYGPHRKDVVQQREPTQPWGPHDADLAAGLVTEAADRLGLTAAVHAEPAGDYHFVADLNGGDAGLARGVALVLSRRLAPRWFRLDRLFVARGQFFRRKRHVELELTRAPEATVPREVRATLRDLL